jgi:hypothetical protein
MDKDVTVRINNLFFDFDETIKFLYGIFSIRERLTHKKATQTPNL